MNLETGKWWSQNVDATVGCSPVSEACVNCWAVGLTHRMSLNPNDTMADRYAGLVEYDPECRCQCGHQGTGFRTDRPQTPFRCPKCRRTVNFLLTGMKNHRWTGDVRTCPDQLDKVLRRRKPTVYFWSPRSDLFHEKVPFDFIDKCFAVMALTPQHTHIVLTKRGPRMLDYVPNVYADGDRRLRAVQSLPSCRALERAGEVGWPKVLPNVYLGVTAENQARWDERVPMLWELAAMGWKTLVSIEPMLGPINTGFAPEPSVVCNQKCHHTVQESCTAPCADYSRANTQWLTFTRPAGIILGGESGPNARPMDLYWVRRVRDDCAAAGVPFFYKQGSKNNPGRTLDGRTHDDLPWGKP